MQVRRKNRSLTRINGENHCFLHNFLIAHTHKNPPSIFSEYLLNYSKRISVKNKFRPCHFFLPAAPGTIKRVYVFHLYLVFLKISYKREKKQQTSINHC